MRTFFLISFWALLSCSNPPKSVQEEPPKTQTSLAPVPAAAALPPSLHAGWNPILQGSRPIIHFEKALTKETWHSKHTFTLQDKLLFWTETSKDRGILVDVPSGAWEGLKIEGAVPSEFFGEDRVLIPRPPPPPPPPGIYPDLKNYWGIFWTGERLLFFDGPEDFVSDSEGYKTAVMYDPSQNVWIPINREGMPKWHEGAILHWTGEELLVWGCFGEHKAEGARFYPEKNIWLPISQKNAPQFALNYFNYTADVWVGDSLVLWNGREGAMYQPKTDTWTTISQEGAPSPREFYGIGGIEFYNIENKLVAWGGAQKEASGDKAVALYDGGIFDPKTNQWTKMEAAPKEARPQNCLCGSMNYTGIVREGDNLFLPLGDKNNETIGWVKYDFEKNTWVKTERAEKKDLPYELAQTKLSFSPKETTEHQEKIELWAKQNATKETWPQLFDTERPKAIFLFEFRPMLNGKESSESFEQVELTQVWIYTLTQ